MYVCMYMYVHVHIIIQKYVYLLVAVFLVSSYGIPLAQRASYLALHSSLFGPDGTVNYDYIITNSINALLIGSRKMYYQWHTH